MFKAFRHHNISTIAIEKVINMHPDRIWIASVYKNNAFYDSINKTLLFNKFSLVDDDMKESVYERNV